ncbi:MAG TPA: PQQ-dependent sugar dehydrogenase [bacterium]|nr:PQQ-dependent sugar dehydrogenase [bacterium]
MKKGIALALVATSFVFLGACGSSDSNGEPDGTPTPTPTPTSAPQPNQVVFTPVGAEIAEDLIDLEFLPGRNGESIAIGLGGTVYYLRADFTPLSQTASIAVDDDNEQGLLNVAADPDYGSNGQIYLYYTVEGSNPDINRVTRYGVQVDVDNDTFELVNGQDIIEFNKNQAPAPGPNHNGGGMVFGANRQLFIGVGDGGGSSSSDTDEELSQLYEISLGKVHRIIPNENAPGFTFPDCQVIPEGDDIDCDTGTPTTVYSIGLRNPFTLTVDEESDLFLGDVGEGAFEEINCVYFANENYGWPHCEGDCDPRVPGFQDPIHGFAHSDETFNNQDPEENQPGGPQSIMASAYYFGDQYDGRFTGKLIYNEFYDGWVRLLTLDAADRVIGDEHIGHQRGLTGLHENPADGLLYGPALFGSSQILRLDLLP